MKVRDLIEKLSKLVPDCEVVIPASSRSNCHPVIVVKPVNYFRAQPGWYVRPDNSDPVTTVVLLDSGEASEDIMED